MKPRYVRIRKGFVRSLKNWRPPDAESSAKKLILEQRYEDLVLRGPHKCRDARCLLKGRALWP